MRIDHHDCVRSVRGILSTLALAAALILESALTAPGAWAQTATSFVPKTPPDATSLTTVRVLPRSLSESLKLTPVPTSDPVPFIVGTYWSCSENAQNMEICRITLVVCTDDQSLCVEL